MILIVLIACIIISTGSFAWGYWISGYEEAARWIIAFGVFGLAAQWRKWKWFSALAVFVSLPLAIYGIWFEFSPGWIFNGMIFSLFAWDLTEFQKKIKLLSPREDVNGMTRRHLLRIGFLALSSVVMMFFLLLVAEK